MYLGPCSNRHNPRGNQMFHNRVSCIEAGWPFLESVMRGIEPSAPSRCYPQAICWEHTTTTLSSPPREFGTAGPAPHLISRCAVPHGACGCPGLPCFRFTAPDPANSSVDSRRDRGWACDELWLTIASGARRTVAKNGLISSPGACSARLLQRRLTWTPEPQNSMADGGSCRRLWSLG